ncbi:MAG: beta-propeller domain-containing protein [Pyrinomonadaceae bacterium]
MKKLSLVGLVVLTAGIAAYSFSSLKLLGFIGVGEVPPIGLSIASGKPRKTMRAFKSEAELKEYFKKIQETRRRAQGGMLDGVTSSDNAAASPTAGAPAAKSESKSKKDSEDDSITNTQHAGVDEGGIVKVHGDHLVILRRGRLFTIKTSDNSLKSVSSVNAYPPGINPSNDWYDEMLISGDRVVVVGYSYGRGGTEINLFDISDGGRLAYRSTHHLRSNDYYSSRNYASRLIGDKLIFYTPQYFYGYDNIKQQFPALRRWHKGAKDTEFSPIVSATEVYRAERPIEQNTYSALHTVTVCDLASRDMTCKGTAVLASPGRVFYVSPKSVYVWTTDWNYGEGKARTDSMLYKMPLDGSAPSALGVAGAPVDQFSFLESDDEQLNVLVRSDNQGEQMWGSERANGDVALFRTTADKFSDGSDSAAKDSYRDMPNVEGYTFQNRFVGDYLLYGTGNGWGRQIKSDGANLFAVNWKSARVTNLHLDHSVDRIEQMGNAAVVVGTNGADLYFSPIRLDDGPRVRPSYIRKKASQGELRSHGFFYKPNGDDSGLLGLPIARQGRAGYRHLIEDSAAILFLKNEDLNFEQIGELEAQNTSTNDGCRASCVDWYGNARPIFMRGRIFALLGYELIEGRLDDNRLRETRRVNYSPRFLSRIDNSEE